MHVFNLAAWAAAGLRCRVGAAVLPLAVERTSRDGVDVLSVEGEIDVATAPRLIAALNDAVAEAVRSVIIDLTSVGFMDSTGLALLINAHRRLTRRLHPPASPSPTPSRSTWGTGKPPTSPPLR